jgi:hypothetical protein
MKYFVAAMKGLRKAQTASRKKCVSNELLLESLPMNKYLAKVIIHQNLELVKLACLVDSLGALAY